MIYILIITTILFIRYFIFKKTKTKAVDQWYWLKYRKAVREQKKCPPNLPEYLIELKQWYPPIFGWFISILPDNFFKYSSMITQLLSLLRLLLIVIFSYLIDIEHSISLFLAVIIYLTAPILIYYDNQINSRVFGAILVDILVLLFFGYFEYDLLYLLIPIFIFTITLLFTHKMSHQLYLFILLGLSIFYITITPILIYIVANLIAIKFFNYKKYLKHHIEIVKFWHRNRYNLGAHQFYESSIYGKNNFVYINRLHGDGIKSFIKKFSLIIGMFPLILFLLFNIDITNFLDFILFLTILFMFLTSFFDKLLCLGAGSLYSYNLVTISSYFILSSNIEFHLINITLLSIVSILTIFSIFKFYKGLKKRDKNTQFENAINFLKNSNLDRIVILPFQLPDEISYKTDKKVFWGAHGYGFLWLEPYFPIFNEKIEKAIDDWNLGAVLLQKDYWPEFLDKVDMNIFDTVFENEKYIILKVKNWKNGEKIPKWAIDKYPDIFKGK